MITSASLLPPVSWGGRAGPLSLGLAGGMVSTHMDGEPDQASEAMARYGAGEERAFAEVYDALAPRLERYLRRRLRNEAAVEDLLQQIFLQIHRARGRFVPGSRVSPWAYSIARAAIVDWLRRNTRHRADELDDELAALDPLSDAVGDLAAAELGDALKAELSGLSPKLREAFLLVRIDGLSHAEAAEVLGIEESATKVRAHRATVWLREQLARFRPREDNG